MALDQLRWLQLNWTGSWFETTLPQCHSSCSLHLPQRPPIPYPSWTWTHTEEGPFVCWQAGARVVTQVCLGQDKEEGDGSNWERQMILLCCHIDIPCRRTNAIYLLLSSFIPWLSLRKKHLNLFILRVVIYDVRSCTTFMSTFWNG